MKIIKIGALWCPACLIVNKTLKQIEKDFNIEIIHLDVDVNEEECNLYNYGDKLPVLIFVNNNEEITRLIGEVDYNEIKSTIESIDVK